ncbi:hypothetical protein QYE76_045962 [Lolium multiflorum]|uniref:DUF4218 domain-containing protein n=1 Tax=Lolium multiflorum TaxID=4521 RepID=A0AAD8WYR1_LOLMU|nr:hypothetical protein QYE76_045962 [Lolium multiflorum]
MWKKKSIFWELEYWKVLDVRSAIDVMHVTKNICVNLLSFLGVYGKKNDTKEARQDQQRLKDPDDRHPEWFQGRASYALTKEEKVIFFECLSSMKVPSGFSSNIKGIINMADKKFQNLKSHDCHVIMTQLLPIALRGLLPENVRVAIVKLCAFLNAISQKVINPEDLPRLQNDVVQCLVSFELVFPPSFFNIMTHLLVHLVEEISILGPVFLHNMFPFERFMGVLKKYVRNRARPEGSIAKGYGNEEKKGKTLLGGRSPRTGLNTAHAAWHDFKAASVRRPGTASITVLAYLCPPTAHLLSHAPTRLRTSAVGRRLTRPTRPAAIGPPPVVALAVPRRCSLASAPRSPRSPAREIGALDRAQLPGAKLPHSSHCTHVPC